jgi:hypothetical protein
MLDIVAAIFKRRRHVGDCALIKFDQHGRALVSVKTACP